MESRKTTLEVWLEAVERQLGANVVEEVDRTRVVEAFRSLERKSVEWPKPAELFELMQPRPERQRLIEPEPTEEERERNKARLRDIIAGIGG